VKNKPINRKDPRGLDDADIAFRETDYYKELERQGNEFWAGVRKTRYEAGYLPENFQCGPSPFTISGGIGSLDFFQKPGGYNFKDGPCFNHDACYQTCGSDKSACDENFYKELIALCESKGNWLDRNDCKSRAWTYYQIVKNAGDSAYSECQTYKCNQK
jgi:hypothetical protein